MKNHPAPPNKIHIMVTTITTSPRHWVQDRDQIRHSPPLPPIIIVLILTGSDSKSRGKDRLEYNLIVLLPRSPPLVVVVPQRGSYLNLKI